MGFEKGHAKHGGRKKGTPNKRTRDLIEILDKYGFCPVSALIENHEKAIKEYERAAEIFDAIQDKRADYEMVPLAADEATKYLKIAQDAAAQLMPYIYPKRKPMEAAGSEGDGPKEKTISKWVIKTAKGETEVQSKDISSELDIEYDH